MLKRLVLLLLSGLIFDLDGSEGYLSHIRPRTKIAHSGHVYSISQEKVAAVLRDTNLLRLFEAADRLISPCKREEGTCKGLWGLNGDTIQISKDQVLGIDTIYTPWATYDIDSTSDFKKYCEIISSLGLGFEEPSILTLKITKLDGQELPKKRLNCPETCVVHYAFKLSPEERDAILGWTSIRVAWVGAAVRAGHARKPVTVVDTNL